MVRTSTYVPLREQHNRVLAVDDCWRLKIRSVGVWKGGFMRSAPSIVCFSFAFDLKELPDLAMVAPQLSSRMNWQQRSGQIYANLMEPGLRSIRVR